MLVSVDNIHIYIYICIYLLGDMAWYLIWLPIYGGCQEHAPWLPCFPQPSCTAAQALVGFGIRDTICMRTAILYLLRGSTGRGRDFVCRCVACAT